MRTCSAVLPILSLVAALSAAYPACASSSHADIAVGSSVRHMSLSVTQGSGGGCVDGFVFQGEWGGCVRQSTDTDVESRACASQEGGVQTRARSRIRYSHQNGSVRYGAYGAWSGWGAGCASTPGPSFPDPPAPGPAAPEPPDPAPDLPKIGATYVVDAWICDSTNSNYAFPAGPGNSNRNKLISTYKTFNFYRRCPERPGYQYWIEQWNLVAQAYASQHNTPLSMAYDVTFGMPGAGIKNRMLDQARERGEHLPDIIGTMDAECQTVADRKYGARRITAVYDTAGNGSRCKVVQVH